MKQISNIWQNEYIKNDYKDPAITFTEEKWMILLSLL
jgi:hypothetical protein